VDRDVALSGWWGWGWKTKRKGVGKGDALSAWGADSADDEDRGSWGG
jgi:hypothetical protein